MALSEKVKKSLLQIAPSAVVNLYRLYYDTLQEPENFFPFNNGTNGFNGSIIFGGTRYLPIAAEIDSTETNIQQRISRPKIKISNTQGKISLLLRRKNELRNAKIVIIKTLVKFLDAENFDSGVNPYGISDPNAIISREEFVVSQKVGENKEMVELELTYPFDLEGFNIAGKTIISNYCTFQYRGKGCNYCGPPIAKADDSSFSYPFNGSYNIKSAENLWVNGENYTRGMAVYVENYKNPPKTVFVCIANHVSSPTNNPNQPDGAIYWEKDECSKTINGCKKRFAEDPTNPCYKGYLPFGGYPATDKYRFG
jgi:lambda family phage minor tail protein L